MDNRKTNFLLGGDRGGHRTSTDVANACINTKAEKDDFVKMNQVKTNYRIGFHDVN